VYRRYAIVSEGYMRRSRSSQLYGTVGAAIPQRCNYAWACSSGG